MRLWTGRIVSGNKQEYPCSNRTVSTGACIEHLWGSVSINIIHWHKLDYGNMKFGMNKRNQKHCKSLGSSVDIATGYGLDDRGFGVRIPVLSEIFTFPYRPDRLQHSVQRILKVLLSGLKRQGLEAATHFELVPKSTRRGCIYPLPPYAFMASA
jgi:hypothetical protein